MSRFLVWSAGQVLSGKRYGNINRCVLKSYVRSAAIFRGICHLFRRALSSVVSLYSAASIHPYVFVPVLEGFSTCFYDLLVAMTVF